jgi:hypothetical protein
LTVIGFPDNVQVPFAPSASGLLTKGAGVEVVVYLKVFSIAFLLSMLL